MSTLEKMDMVWMEKGPNLLNHSAQNANPQKMSRDTVFPRFIRSRLSSAVLMMETVPDFP
jgi:hypothetical protein